MLGGVFNANPGSVTSLAGLPFDQTYWLGVTVQNRPRRAVMITTAQAAAPVVYHAIETSTQPLGSGAATDGNLALTIPAATAVTTTRAGLAFSAWPARRPPTVATPGPRD